MPIGKINKLVHLSQQTYQPNSKLIPGHNDKGYGTIDDEAGREVYFAHDAVPGSRGFDDLYRASEPGRTHVSFDYRNRQTPLNSNGSVRRPHLDSNSRSDLGGRTRSQS